MFRNLSETPVDPRRAIGRPFPKSNSPARIGFAPLGQAQGPRTGHDLSLLQTAILPSRNMPAIPRICRTSRNPALRYRARGAGKPDSPSGSGPGPHRMESIRKDGRFSMKSNEGSSAEAAVFSSCGTEPRRERGRSLGSKDDGKMKIMIFPVKFDKFTGFFDKFLKISDRLTDCNIKSYHLNMSAAHSDIAIKKVFRLPRICPQLSAFPLAPHHASKPSLLGRQSLIHQSALTPAFVRNCPHLCTGPRGRERLSEAARVVHGGAGAPSGRRNAIWPSHGNDV